MCKKKLASEAAEGASVGSANKTGGHKSKKNRQKVREKDRVWPREIRKIEAEFVSVSF